MEGETTASFKVIFAPNLSLPLSLLAPAVAVAVRGGGRMSICINRNSECYGRGRATITKV